MNKEVLRLAIPNIISNVSVPLLSTVDTALMGRLSASHIAAVGIGGLIFNFIYWNFGFLRMGTTGMTAQAFGSSDREEQRTLLFQSLFVGLGLSIVIVALCIPIMHFAGILLNLEGLEKSIVEEYFFIRIWDAPAALALYSILGWLFGMQNAFWPLIITIAINFVNIILSYVLVTQYQLDIKGVAWGSVIAQYFGLLVGLLIISIKFGYLNFFKDRIGSNFFSKTKRFLVINSDIFIRTFCLTLVFGIFYSQSTKYGSLTLAANVVLLLYVNWMSYAIDGFAYAAESMIGKYKGKKDPTQGMEAIKLIFKWSIGIALLITLTYGLFTSSLNHLFTNKLEVIEEVNEYQIWVILFPIFAFVCYIWDGVYIGLTAVKAMRNSMLLAFALFLLVTYLFGNTFGNHGLWAALMLFMVFRGAFQTYLFKKDGLNLK